MRDLVHLIGLSMTAQPETPDVFGPIVVGAIILVAFFVLFVWLIPVGLWVSAWSAGIYIPIRCFASMRLRRIPPGPIIHLILTAQRDGLKDVTLEALERHYLATGRDMNRVAGVVQTMRDARASGGGMTWEEAAAKDLQRESIAG